MQKTQKHNLFEFNKRIVENAPLSIIMINRQGVITFVNRYFRNISTVKNPVGGNIFEMPFFIGQKLCPKYKKLLEDGTRFEKNCKSINGQEYLSIVSVPLRDSLGNIDGALSMASDITEAVVAKQKLKALNLSLKEKVNKKTSQLSEVNKKLEKSLELKSQFISDASHELRTPLAIAKLNLEFKNWEAVDIEINKVTDILSDLSLLTSIDENSVQKAVFEPVVIDKVIESAIRRLEIISREKKIKIAFEGSRSGCCIKADRKNIEKLFLNIIRNAIKYGKKKGWVKILAQADKKHNFVKISVSDNGIGIPKEDLKKIFDRFYRTDISKSNGEGGFGLGLSICKWIVDQHNGRIAVESCLGKGSTFTIILPIIKRKPGQNSKIMYN